MSNVFQSTYDTRLKSWYRLRQSLEEKELKDICIEIDRWWQHAPLVNHYLHSDFTRDWPNPWELLAENNYCTIARGLGMVYTLLLLGIDRVDFAHAKDYNNEDVVLVLVDDAKYILNYWPNMVVNSCLQDFKISKLIDISKIIKKIG
jgi:hypothetical protein